MKITVNNKQKKGTTDDDNNKQFFLEILTTFYDLQMILVKFLNDELATISSFNSNLNKNKKQKTEWKWNKMEVGREDACKLVAMTTRKRGLCNHWWKWKEKYLVTWAHTFNVQCSHGQKIFSRVWNSDLFIKNCQRRQKITENFSWNEGEILQP